jgi:hypothetical protein
MIDQKPECLMNLGSRLSLVAVILACSTSVPSTAEPIPLAGVTILVDSSEPSYIQFGAKDLSVYLTELSGKAVPVGSNAKLASNSKTLIAIGEKMATALGADLSSVNDLGKEGSIIRAVNHRGSAILIIAGQDAHGTNTGIATFLQLIRSGASGPYVDGPLDLRTKPSFAVRGIHLNGWPLRYPYAFRTWKEEDWKRFVDIAWAQRVNLFYLWPFMEIIPLPLSKEDEAYLQEVRRVVDYAQNQRGMEVWIMQSANRVGVSDCGSSDPRFRAYWVMGECQKDMNPADPQDFQTILAHFEALYKNVNNAEGFCMIDSDPGGWPGSPLRDQTKIFNGARKLLDQYNVNGPKTKLIDWMWIGWGRHPTGEDTGGVAFMQDTIRNFKKDLREPWQLIAGMSIYLESAKNESVLNKTVFLQYGAIEMEPAFPATNLGFEPVQKVFQTADKYPELEGIMGNNELMSLQLPRTFYFFKTAWDRNYDNNGEDGVLLELGEQLYPDHKQLIKDAFLALREQDPDKINSTLRAVSTLVNDGNAGRPGAIGRFLFPDRRTVAKNLQLQLEVRYARQALIKGLQSSASLEESGRLLENYFDKLLAWNKETGWDKMIDITIWRTPIYEEGKDLTQAMTNLKKTLAQGKPYTTYTQIDDFFSGMAQRLSSKYGRDSAMIGCIEPFKVSMIQGW